MIPQSIPNVSISATETSPQGLTAWNHFSPAGLNSPQPSGSSHQAHWHFDSTAEAHTFEHDYLAHLQDILENGHVKGDRTGTGTVSKNGLKMNFDLRGGSLPLLSTKQIFHRSWRVENLWFISGSTDVKFLKENGVSIWDDWVQPDTADFHFRSRHEVRGLLTDCLTYLRCQWKEVWDDWRAYKDARQINKADWDDFFRWKELYVAEHGLNENTFDYAERAILKSGSIGAGAYGSLWRNWEDTRIVPQNELDKYRARGYRFITHVPGMHTAVVTRNIDQLANAIQTLKTNPDSRRIIVSAWNPGRTEDASLPPCHCFYQFFSNPKTREELVEEIARGRTIDADEMLNSEMTYEDIVVIAKECGIMVRTLTTALYCRSQDFPVGTPFNFAQYAALTHKVAHVTGHEAVELIWFGGDVHIYRNQMDLVPVQLEREIKPHRAKILLNPAVMDIDGFGLDDMKIVGYDKNDFHPSIPYPVAV